jgi:hypothetical protein
MSAPRQGASRADSGRFPGRSENPLLGTDFAGDRASVDSPRSAVPSSASLKRRAKVGGSALEVGAKWKRRRDTREMDLPINGSDKTARIDLGVELLMRRAQYGVPLSYYDIAAWLGCTDSYVYLLIQRVLRRLNNKLQFGSLRRMGEEVEV